MKIIICKNCSLEKPHKGLGLCQKCYRKESYNKNKERDDLNKKEWCNKNREYYNFYNRERYRLKRKIECKEYFQENKKRINIYRRTYLKKNIPLSKHKIVLKTFRKYGKAEKCLLCSCIENVHHHHYTIPYHEDYFVEVCKECHFALHNSMGLIELNKIMVLGDML